MVADEILSRERFREVPPRVEYGLTEKARQLLPVVGALSRWGARWAWSPPTACEAIDIGAILRSMPGLQAPPDLEGVVELVVTTDAGDLTYTMTMSAGRSSICERPADMAAARIAGSQSTWIAALSPGGDGSALRVTGDQDLAAACLEAIAPEGRATASVA